MKSFEVRVATCESIGLGVLQPFIVIGEFTHFGDVAQGIYLSCYGLLKPPRPLAAGPRRALYELMTVDE